MIEQPQSFQSTTLDEKKQKYEQDSDVRIQSMKELFKKRYHQMKWELRMFLRFHSIFLLCLFLYRFYHEYIGSSGHSEIENVFRSFKLFILQCMVVLSSFTLHKLSFQSFRLFYILVLGFILFYTLNESLMKQFNEIKTESHSVHIISVFYIYCNLFAPFSWKIPILTRVFCFIFYFFNMMNRQGLSNFNIVPLIQELVITFLIGRALYLKEQSDIHHLIDNKNMDRMQRNYYGILQAIPEGVMIINQNSRRVEFTNTQMIKILHQKDDPLPLISNANSDSQNQNTNRDDDHNQEEEEKQSLLHNQLLCQLLENRIQEFILMPIQQTDGGLDNQESNHKEQSDQTNQSVNLTQCEEIQTNDFISRIIYQYQSYDIQQPKYYKMQLRKPSSPRHVDPTESLSKKYKNNLKRRVEIKCKNLQKGRILFILKDVSLYRELEKHRTKNRLKTIFFASFAHELMNPINIISGMTEEALSLTTRAMPQIKDKLQKSMLTIEKLTFLAEDIIDLSKYELKELVPYRNKFSLSETVKSVVDLYTSQIKQKGLRLELNFYQQDDDDIYSDQRKFKRIINNLLGNAVKYTTNGYIKVTTEIKSLQYESSMIMKNDTPIEPINQDDFYFSRLFERKNSQQISLSDFDMYLQQKQQAFDQLEESKGDNQMNNSQFDDVKNSGSNLSRKILKVTIEDTGIGMPERQLNKLFKLFGSTTFKGNVNQGGMGIGLTACNVLCKVLGGYIKATSFKHRGSKFKFYIDVSFQKKMPTPIAALGNSIDFTDNFIQFIHPKQVSEFDNPILNKEQNEVLQSKEDENIGSIASEYLKEHHQDINSQVMNHTILRKSQDLGTSQQSLDDSLKNMMLPQVLVVDDQEFNVEVAGKMIERHLGLSFDSAYSAKEGIEKIWIRNSSNLQYKYIFLDINMPEMDGVEMVQYLRSQEHQGLLNFSDTRIFALTALDRSQLGDINELGFDYFLTKPLRWDTLKQIVK